MKELENKKAEQLIARIPHLSPVHSPNYKEVMDQMNTLVWEEMEDPMTTAPGCSCKTALGVYSIFATDAANGLAKEQLMMHEAGHCILQHFKDNQYKNEQAARQIRSKWPKFREHIDMEGNDEDDISADFIHMIRNITEDLEINGKYWPDAKDFEEVRERISDASLTRFISYANEEQLESIEEWMNEKPDEIHKFSRGVYPADFGFPNGLTWMGYLHLILTQPNEFMDNLNEQIDEMQRQKAQQGQGSSQVGGQQGGNSQSGNQQQGNSSQQNDNSGLQDEQTSIFDHKPKDGENGNSRQDGKNGNGKGKSEQGQSNENKIKASVIKANAQNGDKDNEIAQAMAQARENRGEGPLGQQAAAGSSDDDADDWSAPGDGASTDLVDATPTMTLDRKVTKFIEKHCIGKVVQRDRQDPLYNYNRGKTSGGVMRTRITTVEEYRPGNLIAVVDVSGSVDIELVKAFLSEMLKYKSKFGTKSRIILWDTSLVGDLQLKKSELDKICCGGGTSIARGIHYAKEKYLKSEQDKLCVISDFEDDLNEWLEELSTVKGDAFGICWGGMDGKGYMQRYARDRKEKATAKKFEVINVG